MLKHYLLFLFSILCIGSQSQTLEAGIKFPEAIEFGNFFTVEVFVKKSDINSFMKFMHVIPQGIEAQAIDIKGALLKISDSTLKIIWINPPTENEFTFMYKLKVNSYYETEINFSPKIEFLNGPYKESVLLGKYKILVGQNVQNHVTKKPVVIEKKSLAKDYYFTLQIGVFANKPDIKGINEKDLKSVKTDNGLTKYFVGNFEDYDDAFLYLKDLKNKGYKDAFIVKRNKGQ